MASPSRYLLRAAGQAGEALGQGGKVYFLEPKFQ